MGGLSTDYANVVLDLVLGPSTRGITGSPALIQVPATVYVALFTTVPYGGIVANGVEVDSSGTGYARVSVANDASHWPNASSGAKSNGQIILFPEALGDWGTVQGFGLFTAATSGTMITWGYLNNSKPITVGEAPEFEVGMLVVIAET